MLTSFGYPQIVRQLLQDSRTDLRLLDNNGSSLVDLACERLALSKTPCMKNALEEILGDLLVQTPQQVPHHELITTEEIALERRQRNEVKLRNRIAEAKIQEQNRKRKENQQIISDLYRPLSPTLYAGEFSDASFNPAFQEAKKTGKYSEVHSILRNIVIHS